MATLTHAESRRLYSWWWDSHISPKSSKWLQENLTDMDVKVKSMIKVIEEDADSFARRAEMYYKKRPELMKLVEEFYRAYRALAERYDHATGELRQAQRTMAEAFPNQIPFSLCDNTPPSSSDVEPHTPEMPHPVRAFFERDDLKTQDSELSSDFHTVKKNGACFDENDSMMGKKGLKQLNEMFGNNDKRMAESGEGRVRKGLNFQVAEGKGTEFKVQTGTNGRKKHELKVQDKGIQYEALDLEERENGGDESRLPEDEVSQLSIENQNLKAQILAESIRFKKVDKEDSSVREVLSKLKDEKEAALLQSQQFLDQHHGALGRISDLETEISLAKEEINRLNDEMSKGVTKSRNFEERSLVLERENQNLTLEMDNLVHKSMAQQEEIKQKHKELEKLGIYVQEERFNSMRIEAALQNLQQLHFESQEEHTLVALEFQNSVRILKDMESRNSDLENEILRIKEENNGLNEHNMSSAISMRNLQDELHSLIEKNSKLKEEVGLRVDQRNALQQELYCLKEEINDLERRYQGVKEQIESVGLDPGSVQSSVKELQDESLNLKVICRRNEEEKMVFLEKLGNMDKLSEKNKFLENSLSDMGVEIDDLRRKLKTLEESCRSLHEDKATFVAEKGLLVSQVDSITQSLLNLEKAYSELEDQHSCLKMEKESTVSKIEEMWILLGQQKQENENLARSYDAQLTTLQNRIDLLQEEESLRKQKLEEEEDEFMNVQLESYLLQLSVHDTKEMYELLLNECQKNNEKSAIVDKLVLELEQKNLKQETEFKLLSGEHSLTVQINQKLLTGIQELLKLLDMIDGCPDVEDSKIFEKFKDMQIYILNDQDEKQKLIFENWINATILEQIRLGILDLIEEKESMEAESVRWKGELLILENEKQKLAETNKRLRQELQEGVNRERVLKTEMGSMREQALYHQESNLVLKNENCKLLDENQSFKKDLCNLKKENCKLEEEIDDILTEASTLANLALIFEISNTTKAVELKRASEDLDHFHAIKIDLENEKSEMMEEMGILEMEYVHLTESIEKLEEYRNRTMVLLEELNTVRDLCENLNNQIAVGKKLLSQKDMELEQAHKNIEEKYIENTKLLSDLESVKQELNGVQKIREILVKQNFMLSEEKVNQEKEIALVHEEKARLEFELDKLSREIDGFRLREEHLNSELRNWDVDIATFFKDAQTSSIREALFEVKVCELIETCGNLEENAQMEREKFRHEIGSRNTEIDELKRKILLLEGEYEAAKAESAACFPIILSLRESLTLLEDRSLSLANIYGNDHLKQQDAASISHQTNVINADEPCEGQITEIPDGISELQKLQSKVDDVGKAVMKLWRLNQLIKDEYKVIVQENSNLYPTERGVEELKLQNRSVQVEGQASKDTIIEQEIEDGELNNGPEAEKMKGETSKGKDKLLTKDIELDHVLDNSHHKTSVSNDLEAEDQMLGLWETVEQDCGQESVTERYIEYRLSDVVEEEKSENLSSELQAKKELGIDNVAVPAKALALQQRKLTARLSSNARKLQNLQITIQELENKCENSKKTNQPMGYEYEYLRGQLKQVEKTILKYVGINNKSMKNAEDGYSKMGEDAKEESQNMLKELYELTKKGSSNIRKLELELQRIQLVFHRLDQEREINVSVGGDERRSKVPLRDYLSGERVNPRKKGALCACMRPPTRGD